MRTLGLSSVLILPEVKDSDISTIAPTRDGKPVPTGVITYGHMPLMVTRACPLQNIHDCAHCDKTGLLTDRKARSSRCGAGWVSVLFIIRPPSIWATSPAH